MLQTYLFLSIHLLKDLARVYITEPDVYVPFQHFAEKIGGYLLNRRS
ncbi:hypothetical protein Lser_V15G17401 [Lactuca serriola]